jgi:Nucleotide exchange factor Fes1
MQSLLRWSIENSTTSTTGSGDVAAPPQATRRTDLDPGIIDAILGRPDSELMKEALAKAQDASLDEDARLTALDDLEMVRFTTLHSCATPHNCCICVTAFLLMSDYFHSFIFPSSLFPTSSSRTSIMQMVMHALPSVRC